MDLSSHLHTQQSIDSIVKDRIDNARTTLDGIPTQVTVDSLTEALRPLRRTILCKPECVDRIREALEHEGLSGVVDVMESEYVPEGQAFVLRPILRRH